MSTSGRARRPTGSRPSSFASTSSATPPSAGRRRAWPSASGAELTYERALEADIREHLRRHAYDFVIGSVHIAADSPYASGRVASWVAGRSLAEIVEPYYVEVEAAARSGLFDALGHIDFVKRYLAPHVTAADLAAAPELLEPILRALVESGTALEINTSGLRQAPGESYPSPATVARFRELGGERITIGSDAHRAEHFAFALADGYGSASDAGLRERCRSGAAPIGSPCRSADARLLDVTSHATPLELIVAGAGPSYSDRPGALGAAYLVRAGDAHLLLDLGQGAFPNVAAEVPPERLLATFVSHLHPDHFIDLVSLRHYLHWQLKPPGRARVIGPAGLGDRLDALHAEPGFSAGALDIEALRPGRLTIGPFEVEAARVHHTDDSYGVPRLDRGRRRRVFGRLRSRGGPGAAHPAG